MRTLTGSGVPNITAPSPEYPYGKFKDKTSALVNDGTEVSERTMGDTYQGLLNMVTRAGITPNNQPETKTTSQIADAVELLKPVAVAVVGYNGNSSDPDLEIKASVIRDSAITLAVSCLVPEEDTQYLGANFQIKRNGVVDTSHNYIVTATPVYALKTSLPYNQPSYYASTPRVLLSHFVYFDNNVSYYQGVSNMLFAFSEAQTPSNAMYKARAVLTIYDAGPVA